MSITYGIQYGYITIYRFCKYSEYQDQESRRYFNNYHTKIKNQLRLFQNFSFWNSFLRIIWKSGL